MVNVNITLTLTGQFSSQYADQDSEDFLNLEEATLKFVRNTLLTTSLISAVYYTNQNMKCLIQRQFEI